MGDGRKRGKGESWMELSGPKEDIPTVGIH
jgi:hypothetical protein